MPHVYPVYINRVQEHLAERTKFKKRNHETTQVIKNGFLFTLDFLGSTYLLDHRTKNHVTSQGPLGTPFFYASPKSIYLSSSYPPTKPSCISLFYCLSKFYIPYPSLIYTLSIQYYYHQPALKLYHLLHVTSCRNTHIIYPLQQPVHTTP